MARQSLSPEDEALRGLGQRIAQTRQHHGWTQEQLAGHIGVSLRTVRRMEAGAPGTAMGHIAKVLAVFGHLQTLQQLLGEQPAPHKDAPPAGVSTAAILQRSSAPSSSPTLAGQAPRPPVKRTTFEVQFGDKKHRVGHLDIFRQGAHLSSQFHYDVSWVARARALPSSPDLPVQAGTLSIDPDTNGACGLPGFLCDLSPGAWARKVIQKTHDVVKYIHLGLPPLDEIQYLSAPHDATSLGAFRLTEAALPWWQHQAKPSKAPGKLWMAILASNALERGVADHNHLSCLMNQGCFLGGSRPKFTHVLDNGQLVLAKPPRPGDSYQVPCAEVTALHLARLAGIPAPRATIVSINQVLVALIPRVDRTLDRKRLPYLSAATLLQAHGETRSYADLLGAMAHFSGNFTDDARQLWRRLVFYALITHVDDHLRGIGFLHTSESGWRLAPAFGLTPVPRRNYRSLTPLTIESGPITSVSMLLESAHRFQLNDAQALTVLGQVVTSIEKWRKVHGHWSGSQDTQTIAPAFEHERLEEAQAFLGAGGAGN